MLFLSLRVSVSVCIMFLLIGRGLILDLFRHMLVVHPASTCNSNALWLGGRVVWEPDLRLEYCAYRGWISAAALPSATLDNLFTHMCLCHQAA